MNKHFIQLFIFFVIQMGVAVNAFASTIIADSASVFPLSYHFVDAEHEGDNPVVYALVKNTNVYWQGRYYELDAGEILDIGIVSQGDVIESNKPLSIGSTKNNVDMPVPIEFSGTEFAIPLVRGTHYIYVKNINNKGVDVEFFDGDTQLNYTMQANEITRFESGFNGFAATVQSVDQTSKILVTHNASGTFDAYPVAPAALELFGVRTGSGHIGAIYDDTTVFQYADNGAVSELTINVGEVIPVTGNSGSEGAASFVRITSDKPIGAAQIGDSDGGEQTSFIPQTVFAREYVLPVDTQYVAMGCFGTDSTISVYNPNGELQETTTCESSTALPGKAFLGSTVDGVQFSAGSRIKSTEPIYLIYENALLDDETNLMGSLLTNPHGYHFLNARFQGDKPAVYGIVDNTILYWKGAAHQINAGELFDIGTVSQGDVIESNHALAIGSDRNGTDMPVPIEFAGTQFAIPLQRESHFIYVKNIHNYDVSVDFYNGVTHSVESIPANSISRLVTTVNGEIVATLQSLDGVSKLLVSHVSNTGGDAYSVAPLAKQVFGVKSSRAYIGGIDDDISVTEYADTEEVLTSTLDAGRKLSVIGDDAFVGLGSFVKVKSDKPIGGVQYGDGDGAEQTAFISESMFARDFVLPVNAEYIAMGCIDSNVAINVFSPEGLLVDSTACDSTGEAPGKAYLASHANFRAGSRILATEPIYLIYEASATDDEHNLTGERGQPLEELPSSLNLPSVVSGSSFVISWNKPNFDSTLYSLALDSTVLQRIDSSGVWVTVEPDNYAIAVDTQYAVSVQAEGIYQYRLLRSFTLQNNTTSQTKAIFYIEKSKQLVILSNFAEMLSGQADAFGNAMISWVNEETDVSYELQAFDSAINKWILLYKGSKQRYLVSNVGSGQQEFRIRVCATATECSDYSSLVLQIDEVPETQCDPFVIDSEYQL